MPKSTGKLASPEWRRDRAAKASAAAHHPDTYARRTIRHITEESLSPEVFREVQATVDAAAQSGRYREAAAR